MYKLLLSWRYLRTRWIALASIVSVTLGVATLIIVNSVMAGFSAEMHSRLHDILSDITIESHGWDNLVDAEWHKEEVRKVLGDDVIGMTANVRVPAMLNFQVNGRWITQQVMLIGVDEATYSQTSAMGQYLLHPENQQQLTFNLRDKGYDARLPPSGWSYRKSRVAYDRALDEEIKRVEEQKRAQSRNATAEQLADAQAAKEQESGELVPADPFAGHVRENQPEAVPFDEAKEQYTGLVLGIAICSTRFRDKQTDEVKDYYLCRPGDDVKLTFPSTGVPPKPISQTFTIVDFYESKMSEYDSTFAFVPLSKLQELRGMIDPMTGVGSVSSLQIKLRPGAKLNECRDKLRERFDVANFAYRIQTWKDMQGPLLSAVQMETTILNILLFLIIAVAGFGILATFFMIVVEKTRDIGVLKALGAPSSGVMSIFLSYGFSLGMVGSGMGMILGLLFVANINEISHLLEWFTGQEVFDPTVYYFREIPAIIAPLTVVWVVAGSVLIAVLASVLPAMRAARLHPVEALRYE
ncbi:MAG TPA: FtsX-like permease family protein [Pirellulaceae bacterium]|nr:FtsX-like permease family protein [Pirellulaceae bacterium]